MNFIKKTLLGWKIKRALKEQIGILRRTPNYDQASLIGILLRTEDPAMVQSIEKFVQKLTNEHKKVTILVYTPASTNVVEFQFQHYLLTEKEIDNWGNIHSEVTETFINQPFDYLYCLNKEEESIFQYILAKSKAKCRIGRYGKESELFFEMMIDQKPEQGIDIFIEHALHYTKSITYN